MRNWWSSRSGVNRSLSAFANLPSPNDPSPEGLWPLGRSLGFPRHSGSAGACHSQPACRRLSRMPGRKHRHGRGGEQRHQGGDRDEGRDQGNGKGSAHGVTLPPRPRNKSPARGGATLRGNAPFQRNRHTAASGRRIMPFPPTPIGRTWKPARSPGTGPASPNLRFHDSRYSGSIRKSAGDLPVYPGTSSTFGYRHRAGPQTFPTSPPSRFFKPIFTLSDSASIKV